MLRSGDGGAAEELPVRRAAIALVALVALGLGWRALFSRPQDEAARVREVIDAVIAALEDKATGRVLEHLAPDYRDAGGLDRAGVHRVLVATFLRRRAIAVNRLTPTRVELRPDRTATASFTVAVSEGLSAGALADAGIWDVEVELAEREGAWRITGHRRVRRR
ncbi:MAG: hypothetical protein KatS3mg102_1738 [Planctomycetota bacterium]|nr:MAG: hypothetical protein KatS3mg102_1738 [Planctomycetota bacterium]